MGRFGQIAARCLPAAVILVAATVIGLAAKAASASAPQEVGLVGVRFGGDTSVTRVVLDVGASISSSKLVAEDSTPGRFVIALPLLLSTGAVHGAGKGLVVDWSLVDAPEGARLVLNVRPGATIVRRFVLAPADAIAHWRYVIDIRGSAEDQLAALLDQGAPGPAPRTTGPVGAAATPSPQLAIQTPPPPHAAAPSAPRYAETAPWQPGAPTTTAQTTTTQTTATVGTPPSPTRPVAVPVRAAASPPAAPTPRLATTQSAPGPSSPVPPAPKYAETAPWQPPVPTAAAAPARPSVVAVHTAPKPFPGRASGGERGMKVVVIDAGHGGHDVGAQSLVRNEKDITLAAALSLREHLLKMGHYRVVMTRDSDVFIPLEDRVRIARRAGADLFISLHADSAGSDPTPHGASVYTLSDSGETRVNNVLGPHEWFSHAGDGRPDVRQILLDLTQRSTRNRSSEFASKLLSHIGDKVELLPRSHRDAGYFVLLAPDVPAALLEMGFITNPGDEMRLTDPAQRERLTAAIADAIDDYFYGATTLTAGF
jgi:N-acetylmuramoyl-L-alanine amidase